MKIFSCPVHWEIERISPRVNWRARGLNRLIDQPNHRFIGRLTMSSHSRPRRVIAAGVIALAPAGLVGSVAGYEALFAAAAGAAGPGGTGQAVIFQRPSGAMGLGHVGWGFYNPATGTWTYGAVEGATSSGGSSGSVYIPPGQNNGAWNATGSYTDMVAAMNARGYMSATDVVVTTPNVGSANQVVAGQAGQGYDLIGNNCATTTDNVLTAYGLSGLPSPNGLFDLAPNSWVNDVQSSLPNTTYSIPSAAADPNAYNPNP